MINCSVLTPHVRELGKKLNIENETLLRGLFTAWRSDNPEKADSEITEKDLKELLKSNSQIKGENISSKGSAFARLLTNIGNNLTVEYKGRTFRNAEHAYQTWKSGEFDEVAYKSTAFKPVGTKKVNTSTNYQTMVEIITAKLQQHPELIEGITQRGGLAYLAQSTHTVIGDKYWESSGQNKFIEALIDAYDSIITGSIKTKLINSDGSINWEYFEQLLDNYHNSQPDSMFAKGRYTLATRPENHFEGEKTTLNHIKFVTQSMLNLFEGKFDIDLPFVSEARASLQNQRDLMILAAMFHDVAKPYRHGDIHGWEAADIVRDILGVDFNNRLIEWAVRHHMPMPFSHKAEFNLSNPDALEVAKNIARDAKRLGINSATAINAFILINAADVINGRELSVEDNWAKKEAAKGLTRYGNDISVKNVLTIELTEKVELLKKAFEEIKDENLGNPAYNYSTQERFDYITFPEGGREDKKLPYLNNKIINPDAIVTPIKPQFRGKLIFAQSGTGKTTIADNTNVIDSDFILGSLLGVHASQAHDAFVSLPIEEKARISAQYEQAMDDAVKEGKTVITARINSLDKADVIIYNESAELANERTSSVDRSNNFIEDEYQRESLETIKSKIGNKEYYELKEGQFLADILLEDSTFNIGNEILKKYDTIDEVLKDYLSKFGFTVEEFQASGYTIEMLNRVIKISKAEDITEATGELIAFMSMFNGTEKQLIVDMAIADGTLTKDEIYDAKGRIKTIVYRKLNKDEYFKVIGKAIAEELKYQFKYVKENGKVDNSPVKEGILDKVRRIIKDFFKNLLGFDNYHTLATYARQQAIQTMGLNDTFIKKSIFKPGDEKAGFVSKVDLPKALKENPYERDIISKMTSLEFSLAGSAAMSVQGSIYRPAENPLHDIDFDTEGKNKEFLDENLHKVLDNVIHIRTIEGPDGIASCETYLTMSVPFEIIRPVEGMAVYGIKDTNTGEIVASFVNSNLTILKEGVQGKFLDFFVNKESRYGAIKYQFEGETLLLTDYRNSMHAKIYEFNHRLKDIWDFNRFVPNREVKQPKTVQSEGYTTNLDIISVNISTPRAKLNASIDPNLIPERAKLIADTFYNICDAALEEKKKELREKGDYMTIAEWEASVYGRAKGIKTIPVKELLRRLQDHFRNAASINEEWQKIWDNFLPLLEDACVQIERDSGLRLTLKASLTSDGTNTKRELGGTFTEITEEENTNLQDNTEGEATDKNELSTFKARYSDPHATVSLTTKHILRRIEDVDEDSIPREDDLGNPKYINEEYAHAILVQELSEMNDPDDFAVFERDEEGNIINAKFPLLDRMAIKIPWVSGLIDILENEPDKIPAFYHDFRNSFISYYMYKEGILMPMNRSNIVGSTLAQVKRDYEQGNTLNVFSIYDNMGKINLEHVEPLLELSAHIEELLDELDSEDEEEVMILATKASELFKAIGMNIRPNSVKSLILQDANHTAFKNAISTVDFIIEHLEEVEEDHLITYFNSSYVSLAKAVGDVSDLENMASFRQGKKTYYSYSAPNFADIQVTQLKRDGAPEYIDKEFGFDEFFSKKGHLRNKWLDWLKSDANIRKELATFDLKTINWFGENIDYTEWTSEMIDTAFISAYFSAGYKEGSQTQYAYYHYPIFSDSPVAKFIKMPRFTGKTEDIKKQLLPLLREVVLQECDRMQLVIDREKAGSAKIANFDGKRGKQFCFFPQLNGVNPDTGNNYLTDIIEFNKKGDIQGRNLYIEDALRHIMDVNFIKFSLTTNALTEDQLKTLGHGHLTAKEALEEYYWNSVYAQTQIIQITTKDLAFYKNAVDFQKRYKQVYAAGKRLFTNSQYGRKFENVLYLKDSEVTYSKLEALKTALESAITQGRITKMDRDAILNAYRKVNATDAQGFRSMTSYRAILDMMGQWNPMMEDALNKMREGKWDMSHYNIVWQTIKPFMFGSTIKPDGRGGKMRVVHQNKDSELLLLVMFDIISADAYSPQIRALNEFMENNNIDLVLYESGCKVGNQGIIDLNYSQERIDNLVERGEYTFTTGKTIKITKDDNESNIKNIKDSLDGLLVRGKITSEEYDEIFEEYLPLSGIEVYATLEQAVRVDEIQDGDFNKGERPNDTQYFNPEVVHTFSYNDYMIAQPTPEHLMDTETIFGSQFRNLIIADLPSDFKITVNGVNYTRQEIIDLYNGLIIDNLLDSFEKLKNEFKSIEAVQQKLRSMVEGNPKFERDILQALEIVEIIHPVTGNKVKTFNIPLNNPSTTEKLQELILSAFKNGVTKQKIKGGNAILCSNVGYTDELRRVVDSDGTLIGYQCYLPATSKQWFESLLTEVEGDNGEVYKMLDIDKLDDELKEALGFRIPTEHKYSMVPLIIKGFLPQQNGSSIMVAKEITTASGCDFDVDKLFLMLYNFYIGKDGKAHKIKAPNLKEKPTEEWTKEERDNMMIDISRAILTHPDMAWINSKPGSFDNLKRQTRKARILENSKMLRVFYDTYEIKSGQEFEDFIEKIDLDELTDFVNEYSEEVNPLELTTFKQFHKQNMTGGALIGIYANNTTMQAKFQETSLAIKDANLITVNGVTYKSLSSIYSKDGKLISFNCSESSAASVDNAKDPVLADLMQNTDTAKILCLLLRTGMPIKDACAFFNIPVIRNYIKQGKNINKFADEALRVLNVLENVLGISDNNKKATIGLLSTSDIITSEIIDQITYTHFNITDEGETLGDLVDFLMSDADTNAKKAKLKTSGYNEGENREFLVNYFKKNAMYLSVFSNIVKISEDLKKLTKVSRADSPNGAIAHNIEEAVIQVRKVDLIHIKEKESTLEGLGQTLKNQLVDIKDSKSKMKEIFMKTRIPRLQAFHSLGIELPLKIVGKYFVQTNRWMQEKTLELFNQSPSGILSPKQLKTFYQAVTMYYLTSTSTFGNDGKYTFEEKRDWYIYEFPKYFINLRNENPELNKNSVIQKLEIESGKILMKRGGKLTPTQRQMIGNAITSLLYKRDEIHLRLAADLLLYAFYTTGLNFGPDNYGMFFNVDFYNQFPEFVDALRKMEFYVNEHANNSVMTNFMDQFYAIHGTYFTRVIESPSGPNKVPDAKLQLDRNSVKNQNEKGKVYKYITISYNLEETKEIERDGEKKTVTINVNYNKLYKLGEVINETATYYEVGSIYDPATGKNRYNANLTAKELSQLVNSEETQNKAEELKKYSYKKGARKIEVERLRDEKLADTNMINAIAFVEGWESNQEMPDDGRFVSLEERGISVEEASRYIEDERGNGINDDVTTGSFEMEGFDESAIQDDSKYEPDYSQLDNIDLEGYFSGFEIPADIEEYLAEEGNAQLEEPMCKTNKKK